MSALSSGSPISPAERRRAFRLLFVCLIVTGAGNSILFSILPPLARDLALPDVSVGFVYTLAATLFVLASPVWGQASDRYGRRPMLVLSFSAYAVSMVCVAGVIVLGQSGLLGGAALAVALTLARAIYGGFASAGTPSAQAWVADRTTPSERTAALGGLNAAFGVGAAAAPGVAAWIAARYGLVTPVLLAGLLAVIAAVAIALLLPERTPPRQRGTGEPGPLASFAFALDPRVSPFLVYGLAIWLTHAVTLQTVSFYVMDTLGVDGALAATRAGAVLMAGAFAMLLAQLVLVRWLKWTPRRYLITGAALVFFAHVLFALAASYAAIMAAMIAAGLALGLARPGMAGGVSLAVGRGEQGKVAGLIMAATGVGFLLAPFTGLLAYQTVGPAAPWAINAALAGFAFVFALAHPGLRRRASRAPEPEDG